MTPVGIVSLVFVRGEAYLVFSNLCFRSFLELLMDLA